MILQEIIDAIKAGTKVEKIEFAKIITKAQEFLDKQNSDYNEAQRAIDLEIVNIWWKDTIQPTIKWNNSQPIITQFRNLIDDVEMLEQLSETDRFRKGIILKKIKMFTEQIKHIKTQIKQDDL